MKNQKGFAPIFIIVGILTIATVAGGAYYLGTRKPVNVVPSPTPTVTSPSDASSIPTGTDETANWKTYTNTKLGYEIKYPQSKKIEKYNLDEETSNFKLDYINLIEEKETSDLSISSLVVWSNLEINIIDSTSFNKWCDLLQIKLPNEQLMCASDKLVSAQINGQQAFQVTGGLSASLVKVTFIYHNNYVYEFTGTIENANGEKVTIPDQILSTFKFTQ